MRRRYRIILSALSALAVLALVQTHIVYTSINVTIANLSGRDLSGIRLIYNGEDVFRPSLSLPSHGKIATRITGQENARLTLKFKVDNVDHIQHLDVYFEPDYYGEIEVFIDSEHKVNCKDRVEIRLL